MAKDTVTERIAHVQFTEPRNIFGVPLGSVSETMAGVTIVRCAEGIRVFKDGQDGYETIWAAGIAVARTRTEPRVVQ